MSGFTDKYTVVVECSNDEDDLTHSLDEGEEEQNHPVDKEGYQIEYMMVSYLIQ